MVVLKSAMEGRLSLMPSLVFFAGFILISFERKCSRTESHLVLSLMIIGGGLGRGVVSGDISSSPSLSEVESVCGSWMGSASKMLLEVEGVGRVGEMGLFFLRFPLATRVKPASCWGVWVG